MQKTSSQNRSTCSKMRQTRNKKNRNTCSKMRQIRNKKIWEKKRWKASRVELRVGENDHGSEKPGWSVSDIQK